MRPASASVRTAPMYREYVFGAISLIASAGFTWLLLLGKHAFQSSTTLLALVILLICTFALLWWLSATAPSLPADESHTRRGRLFLVGLLVVAVLFPLRDLVGPPLLFALPVLALLLLAWLHPPLNRREVTYALLLALAAGVAGLGAGWVTFSPALWAGLQVALVLPGLLAGWSLLQSTGLLQAGFGRSQYLVSGIQPALRGFLLGVLVSLPWALGLVVLGAADSETWVHHLWQPLVAIQPAISEEAWGRVLLIPLLYLLLRRAAAGKTALTVAVLIMAYWFAYLHTPGGIGSLFSTLMIGTLFVLPTTYLWLWQGLETAIGYHFCLDFIKFLAAYLMSLGWIPT